MDDSFPVPDCEPSRGGPVLRWGVLGPGEIAADFTAALHRATSPIHPLSGAIGVLRTMERVRAQVLGPAAA